MWGQGLVYLLNVSKVCITQLQTDNKRREGGQADSGNSSWSNQSTIGNIQNVPPPPTHTHSKLNVNESSYDLPFPSHNARTQRTHAQAISIHLAKVDFFVIAICTSIGSGCQGLRRNRNYFSIG